MAPMVAHVKRHICLEAALRLDRPLSVSVVGCDVFHVHPCFSLCGSFRCPVQGCVCSFPTRSSLERHESSPSHFINLQFSFASAAAFAEPALPPQPHQQALIAVPVNATLRS